MVEIKHPEWLQLGTDNGICYGYDQEWYPTSFQQTRGCGPTAAAMLLSYLNQREPESLPYQSHSISQVIEVLENTWGFITPNWLLGLNSTKKFCQGAAALLRHYRLRWQCERLSIPARRGRRPGLAQVVRFLEQGIASDCPVAFLNLDNGKADVLESWHWIVVVSLELDTSRNRWLATCYDGGDQVTFDVGLWLQTTRFGGGFVYITVPENRG